MLNPAPSPSALAVRACIAGLLSLAVAMGIGRFAFTPLLPLMVRGGGLDVAWGGWLAAANYAGYLAGALLAARIPLAPMRLALGALLATAVLTAGMGAVEARPLWLLLRLAAGAASALAFVATGVWCLGALARLERPGLGGLVYAGVGAGIAAAGLHTWWGGAHGLAAAALWWQLGGVALLLTAVVALAMRGLAPVAPTARPAIGAAASAAPPGTAGLVACYGLLGFGYILPATYLPVLARQVVDDPAWFGMAWPVFGATAAASTFVAAWALRYATRVQVWAVSHVLMGLGVLLPSLWLAAWSIALSALLVGGTFMVVTLAGIQEARARAAGNPTALVGRMTAAFAIGQIAGPLLSSLLLHWPAVAGRGLTLALQVGAASLLLSAVWLWRQSSSSALPSPKETAHARR